MCETNNGLVRSDKYWVLLYSLLKTFDLFFSSLSISVGAAYVQKYFNEESKKAASNLVDRIHEEFVKTLKNVPWMDDETKAAAIDKVGTVDYHIGYPNELADNNKLEEHYSGLELDPNSYLQSLLRIRNFEINNFISKLRQPVNKTDWESHSMPAIVNAFYSSLENSIRKANID